MSKKKFMVTSALPYANGPIHLGHVAGAYLPADIFVRFNRLIGNDILYMCGTDEHGVPITLKAEKEGVTPRTIVKRYHEDIKNAFDRMNIVFDNFSGTSNVHNRYHAMLARDFFINLLNKDYIVSRLSDQHFCKTCDRFLPDRFIQGICPNCGYEEARGDECPECNYQFDPIELKETICKICSGKPELETTKHWYLRLDAMQKDLEKWIDGKTYWKENVINFVKGWFKQGLKERAITRDLYWGVPLPIQETGGKVLYVWFDAPIGYVSSTMEWAEKQGDKDKWKEYWLNSECQVVHFIGKDNIPFHAIIWPGMLMGQKDSYQLPWHVPANEYLNFGMSTEDEALKGSTSRGNVVWVHDALDAFPADMYRFYLASNAPEKTDTLFTWKDFQKKCNGELLGVIGNLANRVLKFVDKHFDSAIPEAGKLQDVDNTLLENIKNVVQKVKENFEKFEVRAAVGEVIKLSRAGNQYFDEKAPWKSVKENKEDCATCMYVTATLVNALSVMLSPVVPESMTKLRRQLGFSDDILTWEDATKDLSVGQKIHKPEGIFQKIEDAAIKPLEEKLAEAINVAPKEEKSTSLKENIVTLDNYAALDIRIAEIIEAKKVKKTDKLMHIKVKVGNEERELVSGIAQHYKAEDLIGKKVPILANLKPCKIKGIESKGMMLCADIDGKPVILTPDSDVPSGSPVN